MKTNRHREQLAQRVQRNLEEMGAIAPADAVRRPFTAEKAPIIDSMNVPDVEPTEEEVLKYGRRVAQDRKSTRLNSSH